MPLELNAEVSGTENENDFVIVHGLFGSISNWRSIAKVLSKAFRVHNLDLRNHGGSPWSDSMSYLEMAGDLNDYIISQSMQKPYLMGHSMGGKTCMTLLQNFEIQAEKVFIVDISPVTYSHNHDQLISALSSLNLQSIENRTDADRELENYIDSKPLRQFLLQNLKRGSDGFEWRINLKAISGSQLELFGYPGGKTCDADILFIRGDNSDYVLPEYEAETMKQFPNAQFETVQNAGHWLHAEQPAALLKLLNQNLDGILDI